MNIVNLTGHDVNIYREEDCAFNERHQLILPDISTKPAAVLKPTGLIRARTQQKAVGSVAVNNDLNCKISIVTYGEPMGEPAAYNPDDNNTYYLVSVLAAKAMNQKYGRILQNLIIVNNTVRSYNGQIIGCTGFARVY